MKGEYKIGQLVEEMKKHFGVFTDSSLAKQLGITKQRMGEIVRGVYPVSAHYLICFHEATNWNIAYIRHLLGDESEQPFEPPKKGENGFYWDDGIPVQRKSRTYQRQRAMPLMRRFFS